MTATSASTAGRDRSKEALVMRLRRVEGQVRGIEKVVEDDRSCIDILTQVAAAATALEAVACKLLDGHVRHCIEGAVANGDPRSATRAMDEMLAAVSRFARTR